MSIMIGLIMVYICSVGFSAKYRDKYAEEKEKSTKLRKEMTELKHMYEAELMSVYRIAKDHGWKGEL